jgi:hypothetical protein
MAHKVLKKYALNICGVICINQSGNINVIVEDSGEFDLATLMHDFNGQEVKLNVTYDEDYGIEDNEDTGEIVD